VNNSSAKIELTSCVLQDENFTLHPYAGMYWNEQNTLFVSDTHFGKITHFRKAGLAVPFAAIDDNWQRLGSMIETFQPHRVIFLGDLFHSDHNLEWNSFKMLVDTFSETEFSLVMGNHDILSLDHYIDAGLTMYDTLEIGPFIFSHHPLESPKLYNIYGHIHPSAILVGYGGQRLKLPCFYFGKKYGIMPAFGTFTGTAVIPVRKDDQVFCIAEQKIYKV